MTIIILAIITSSALYLLIGFSTRKHNNGIADLLPIIPGRNAKVASSKEFSSSTIATTISLATIVIAYFELAGYFGLYLFWTVITTAIGMFLVSRLSNLITSKMNTYDHKPSLHEFIGTEYNSRSVIFAASACTSIGALLIFATELIVGSRFLAGLIPEIPEWITVTFMCTIGFLYTAVGGFRAVITTDRLQMKFIWGLIVVLVIAYSIHIFDTGFSVSLAKVPNGIFDFSPRRGLFFFLIGIAIMNIPTHISNMSIWQRISGAQQPEFVVKGFRQSIWGTALSWGSLATLACCAYMIVTPENDKTLFTDMLAVISENPLGKIFLFFIVLGLYGAMLSTASTLLIVVTHTISEDIIARMKSATLTERINSKNEFIQTRIILAIAALIAIFLVEGLKYIGFSIADLVFAIYGGSLALFPLILFALLGKREKLQKLSSYAVCAVSLGFLAGWGTAVYGKIIGNGNLIFLSSGFSISVAFIVILIGFVINKQKS